MRTGCRTMESVHDKHSADLAARETLLESITTEEVRGNYVRSASALSSGTAGSDAAGSVRGH